MSMMADNSYIPSIKDLSIFYIQECKRKNVYLYSWIMEDIYELEQDDMAYFTSKSKIIQFLQQYHNKSTGWYYKNLKFEIEYDNGVRIVTVTSPVKFDVNFINDIGLLLCQCGCQSDDNDLNTWFRIESSIFEKNSLYELV